METVDAEISGGIATMFKSYYVVWKHLTKLMQYFSCCGLNRTMQYGNEEEEYMEHRNEIV